MSVARRFADKYFLASLFSTLAVVIYFGELLYVPLLLVPAAVGILRVGLPILRSRFKFAAIDLDLLFLLIHMYAISTGKPPRKRLFQLNCIVGGYGDYGESLNRIATLAVDWAYGFVSAIRHVSRSARNRVFTDFLLRFSEVLRTGEDPVNFLQVELSAMRRNYQSQYYRSIDVMRIVLGLHTTLMSSAAFILTVMAVLLMITGGDINIYVMTLIGSASLVALFTAVIYVVVPKEWLTPRVRPKPSAIYRRYRVSLIFSIPAAIALGYLAYTVFNGLEYSLMVASGALLIPGLVARRLENRIRSLETFYTIFIRSFGLTYAVIPNYARALHSMLMSDFGPLMRYLALLYSKISNGIDPKIAWKHFIFDTWSELIMRSTNIFVDTVDVGGNVNSVGTILSDILTRINDLRSARERVARTFEATTYIMQALVSAISMTVISLIKMFSDYIQALTTGIEVAEFYGLPIFVVPPEVIAIINNLTIIFLASLTIMNALAIKLAYGGVPESFWQQVSILLIVTSGAVVGMRLMMNILFGGLLIPPIIALT